MMKDCQVITLDLTVSDVEISIAHLAQQKRSSGKAYNFFFDKIFILK